jgi:hypothetical protein
MASLEGKVTLDGSPLRTGIVTFHNLKDGPSGYSQIWPDGSYSARTGSFNGLRPGQYAVTVSAYEAPAPAAGFVEKMPQAITPVRYANPEASGITYTLPPSGGRYDVELSSKLQTR